MEKHKPNVFVNPITKQIENCQKIYYSRNDPDFKRDTKDKNLIRKINKFKKMTVNQKINYLINLPKYLFNIELQIITVNETLSTKIIGKNTNNLITIDSKLIPIKDIIDIIIIK